VKSAGGRDGAGRAGDAAAGRWGRAAAAGSGRATAAGLGLGLGKSKRTTRPRVHSVT
jgi:hypothetical protein